MTAVLQGIHRPRTTFEPQHTYETVTLGTQAPVQRGLELMVPLCICSAYHLVLSLQFGGGLAPSALTRFRDHPRPQAITNPALAALHRKSISIL